MKKAYMWVDTQLTSPGLITGVRLPLLTALDAMKAAGFDGIEPMIGDPFRFDAEGFQREVLARGLEVSQICTGELYGSFALALNHPDPSLRREALRAGEQVARLAGFLRCPVGIGRFRGRRWESDTTAGIEPDTLAGHDAALERDTASDDCATASRSGSLGRMAESLLWLDHVAREEGIRILLEPLRPDVCDTLTTVAETAAAIRSWGLGSTGWLLDTDHVDLSQRSAVLAEAASLGYVHLADSRHRVLGRGSIDFVQYLELVAEAGYRGYCGVEVFPDPELDDLDLLAAMGAKVSGYFETAFGGEE